ncbi:hypothetical protein D3C71_2000270 [compost metagenome]
MEATSVATGMVTSMRSANSLVGSSVTFPVTPLRFAQERMPPKACHERVMGVFSLLMA